jgi:hypothetical protein
MIRLKDRSPPKKSSANKLTARIQKTMPIGQLIKIIHPQFLKTEIMKTLDLKRKADNNLQNGTATAVQTPSAKNGAMPNSTAFDDKKDDAKKVETAQAVKVDETPKPQAEAPKAEEKKEEAKPVAQETKPALNLEGTLKLVEELHRRKIHRDNLLTTINTLDGFKVLVQDENEDIDSVQFQGCKLTIEDDDRNSFVTKNPAIIKAVAEFVNKLCVDKLAEIEANIVIPA